MSTKPTIRRFRYDLDIHSVILAINTAVLSEEMAHEINNFLSGNEDRLERSDDDVYRVVGRMFAYGLIGYMVTIGGGVVSEDSGPEFVKSVLDYFGEGWPDADQLGIAIEDAYVEFPEESSMDDEELEGGAS